MDNIINGKHENEVGELAKAVKPGFGNKEAQDSTGNESLEKNPKNPMLISPVIRCILQFLNIEDIKNCRLVSHEWGSIGKLSLASRAKIHIHSDSRGRRLVDFQSCSLNSGTLFSSFQIYSRGHHSASRTIEELNKFFEDQQKSIKELTLQLNFFSGLGGNERVNNIDISSWISKSPMVHKNTNYMTKLTIEGDFKTLFILPFHLIAEIKDITLSSCRINLDNAAIKIRPTKLKVDGVIFYQGGTKFDQVQINDFVDFSKAEEVSLLCWGGNSTPGIVDFRGNVTLEKLILVGAKILNGQTSQWVIEHLEMYTVPYSLHSEMKIKELFLHNWNDLDLATLPNSIQKLGLHMITDGVDTISCSQPIVLQNLEYLNICLGVRETDLSHFKNCPRLTHLKFDNCIYKELKSHWMPMNLKTLTLEDSVIQWADEIRLNLEKLVVRHWNPTFKNEIRVDDLVLYHLEMPVDKHLDDYLENRNLLHYVNRLYIGKLDWEEKPLEESVLKEYVNVKSSFYVFENEKKGCPVSEKAFHELMPKHMDASRFD